MSFDFSDNAMVKNPRITPFTFNLTKQDETAQVEKCKDNRIDDTSKKTEETSTIFHQASTVPPSPAIIAFLKTKDEQSTVTSTEDATAAAPKQTATNASNQDINPFARTSMVTAAKKFWANEESEPPREQQLKKDTKMVSKKAQELIDLFQDPNGMVSIVIPSGKKFTLHIGVLVEKCDYVRAALTGNFSEANTKQLNMPDVSDNTFGFFLKWIYSGSLKPERDFNRSSMHNESSLTLPVFFDLWFFADSLRAPALQNHVVINIVDKFKNFLAHGNKQRLKHIVDCIKMLWKPKRRTDRGELAKPLRELILDFVANPQYMPTAQAEKLIKAVPSYFLHEFALITVERNFSLVIKMKIVGESLLPPVDHDSEYDSDSVGDRLDESIDAMTNLRSVWEIKPEKYFVKNDNNIQETE